MGQRLVIELVRGKQRLANAYYHWSGYTSSALYLANEVIQAFDDTKELTQEYAVELLRATEATLATDENASRNAGLIEVSHVGMEENLFWQEALVTLDLEEKRAEMDITNITTVGELDEEDFEHFVERTGDLTLELSEVSFEDFDNNYQQYLEIYEGCWGIIDVGMDEVINFIEKGVKYMCFKEYYKDMFKEFIGIIMYVIKFIYFCFWLIFQTFFVVTPFILFGQGVCGVVSGSLEIKSFLYTGLGYIIILALKYPVHILSEKILDF